ncbi:MAG: type II secretion system protein [Patescibacteria group bacterium]
MSKNGFTLIEMLIYIAIIGGILASFVSFSLSISNSRNKTYVVQEVQANTREALSIITQKIRSASGVNITNSRFDVDPGYLYLTNASTTLNPTIIRLNHDNGVVEIKEGANASTTIMADEVRVINFIFANLTGGSRENIGINMTVEYGNPSNDPNFAYSQSLQTSVSVRY